jgi:FkbM family methyltransferase
VRFYEVAKTPAAFRHKLERDLVILQEETRDKPDNARWWYYLGQTLDGLQRHREAADAYRHCATLDGWAEEAAWACYQAAKCLSELKEYRQAIQTCAFGLARQPGSPELAWLAGFCCFQLGEFRDAIHWEQIAIALGNVEGTNAAARRISFRHLPGWYEGPYDVLRFAYRRLGMEDAARDAAEKHQRALQMRLEQHKDSGASGDKPDNSPYRSIGGNADRTMPGDLRSAEWLGRETRHSNRETGHNDREAGHSDGNCSITTNHRKVFFDLGAHYGESLRQFVTQLPLDATWEIHSFEPNPACELASRLSNFHLPVQVHESAIWVHDGTIAFRQQNHRTAACASPTDGQSAIDGWGSCLESLGSSHPGLEPAIEVACEDLARILEAYSPDDYVVVKMDVEGAEFAILRHLIQRRVINRIKRLYVEWHDRLLAIETPDSRDDLEREVRNHGVEVVRWG